MDINALCEYLPWDSEFFGFRIGRVNVHRLTADIVAHIETWATAHDIACLYFLADPDDDATVRVAEVVGFHLVDIRITLQRDAARNPLQSRVARDGVIRTARESDIAALQDIARVSHHDTRFYHDHHFPRSRCDDLYATWIANSCRGYADTVLVAELDNQLAGYVTCKRVDASTGEIGLLAVAAAAQGLGVGGRLVDSALLWFGDAQLNRVSVVTQGRNCKAQRLYQRHRFATDSLQLSYHRWFTGRKEGEPLT